MAERDRTGFLDVLQRPRELLGIRLRCTNGCSKRKANHTQVFHSRFSPFDSFPQMLA